MSYFTDPYLLTDLFNIQEQIDWNIFVETGTEAGNTSEMLSFWGFDVYSCEPHIHPAFDDFTRELKDGYYDVIIEDKSELENKKPVSFTWWNESSLTALPKIFNRISTSNFFLYLDAHIDFSDNPSTVVLDELELVYKHKLTPIIIIHDFDTKRDNWAYYKFDNRSLDLDYVKPSIDKIYGEGKWDFMYNKRSRQMYGFPNGCIYFFPKSLGINKKII